MMTLLIWLSIALASATVAYNLWLLRRLRRLDKLLSDLCVAAFMARHAPIWQAWAKTMGHITVEVSAARQPWSE